MSAPQEPRDHRRYRLATNDNETIVEDGGTVADEADTEGHRLATNDNETIVPGARRIADDQDDEILAAVGVRRIRAR